MMGCSVIPGPAKCTASFACNPSIRKQCFALRAEPGEASSSDRLDVKDLMPFTYQSSDGRRKASLEDAVSRDSGQRSVLMNEQPWTVGWQVSERSLNWNNDLAARLVKNGKVLIPLKCLNICLSNLVEERDVERKAPQRVTASQLDCTEDEMERRFLELAAILPGINDRMHTVKADLLAKLLSDPSKIAERLLQLKSIFPAANVQQMALRDFGLILTKSVAEIAQAAKELKEVLPSGVDIDRLCQEYPSMLEIQSFKDALTEVKRLMPKLDIAEALTRNPEIIFSTQRHKAIIPYDAVPQNLPTAAKGS